MGKTVFIGGFCTEGNLSYIIEKCNGLPVFSSDPLQKDIVRGLNENLKESIDVYNMVFFPNLKKTFKVKKSVEKTSFGRIIHVPFRYCRVVQHFSKYVNLVRCIKKDLDRISNVVVYSTYFPFMMFIKKIKKIKPSLNVILVVPDLPQFMGLSQNQGLYSKISKRVRISLFVRSNDYVDSYVLLTKYMNDAFNKDGKPNVVVEGISPCEYIEYPNVYCLSETKKVIYAGTLQLKYGIKLLLDAIPLVNDKNVQFVFYGDGEGKRHIQEAMKADKRIVYGGVLSRDKLYLEQQKATVLINPRTNENEFTKYSFPSKTLEYMLSGRPVIAYKLDGIPDEYDDYIIYPNGEGAELLAMTLEDVLSRDNSELENIGKRAKEFVVNHKNYIKQTRKIMELLK